MSKAKTTAATMALTKAGIEFTPYPYDYESGVDKIGVHAAHAINKPEEQVFKTLVILADNTPVCAVIPSHKNVAMKKLAAACGAKHAQMINPQDAERITGFKVGGISPFGQKKKLRIFIDKSAINFSEIYINGGARGLLLEVRPNNAAALLAAEVIDITQ
jgi:Cys-tRNA(Pro)/Cys-tRNA(Cys) deacylase